MQTESSPISLVHSFYEARRANDPEALRPWLAADVRWSEPTVGDHMGMLIGSDAVIDMLQRALVTTGGTFTLDVADAVETGNRCAAVIRWHADKNGETIHGEELAVFAFSGGKIAEASFFASNIQNDVAFWT
jgi:ketosteroid isomerase-like protein